jgi:Flp pilus assembly protein TadG
VSRRRSESGQSTVEFALVLPLAVLVLSVALFGLLEIRDRILVVHAARAAARVAASSDDRRAIEDAGRNAAPQLKPERLEFEIQGERKAGSLVGVRVRYHRRLPSTLGFVLGGTEELSASVMLPAEVAD